MALKPLFFTLALALAMCATFKKTNQVPQQYVENLAKIVDNYAEPHNEKKSKLHAKDIKLKNPGSKRTLNIRVPGRTITPIYCFIILYTYL